MKKYEEIVYLSESEIIRINKLLAIHSFEEMTDDELIANDVNTDTREGVFYAEFSNGAALAWDLCSGRENYWDDVVWTSPDGKRDIVLDCEYELNDIEVEIESEIYIVHVMKS
jgi:hypothetical protein